MEQRYKVETKLVIIQKILGKYTEIDGRVRLGILWIEGQFRLYGKVWRIHTLHVSPKRGKRCPNSISPIW